MIDLLGSVIASSYLTLAFKFCERKGVSIFQAIVFNYLTCVVTGSFVNGGFPINASSWQQSWFHWAVVMGCLFITLFNIIGITAVRNGVAVASVANKLSLVIPFVFAILFYKDGYTWIKLLGVALALVAVYFTCLPSENKETTAASNKTSNSWLLPVVLFVGSGLLDTLINYVQKTHINTSNSNAYLISGFFFAFCIGACLLGYFYATGKQEFQWKHVLAGLLIGVPNYFSIWFLVRYLGSGQFSASAAMPVNNMGIVLFSSLAAWLLFKEKLSSKNWLGISLSVLAIALIAFGD
jgi:drug/metabolite transporter (DMT)-like permease